MARAVATVTGSGDVVIIGSGALIKSGKNLPADLMMTPEADMYVRGVADAAAAENAIAGSVGEATRFHTEFGYYVDPVGERTAVMPRDWGTRAARFVIREQPLVTLTCPHADDLALSKCVSWREKDKDWLRVCARHGFVDLDRMSALMEGMDPADLHGLDIGHLRLRMDDIRAQVAPGRTATRQPAHPLKPKRGGTGLAD